MSQVSYDIQGSDSVKTTLKTTIDNYFQAVLTKNSGASAPSATYAFMWWADTTNGLLKRRDSTNSNWLTICRLDDVGGLRTNAGNPNGAVTGSYQGERLYDTTNNVNYFYSGSGTVWYGPRAYASKTADYTLTILDDIIELGSGAAANRTFTLPAASTLPGKQFTVTNRNTTYKVTLDGNGSETIDGLTTLEIWPGNSITFYSDGSNWVSQKQQGRGRVLIDTKTASNSATIEFTNFPSYFSTFELEFENVAPATDNVSLVIRTSTDGGSSYTSAAGSYYNALNLWSNTSALQAGGSENFLRLTSLLGNAANETASGKSKFWNMLNSSTRTKVFTNSATGSTDANLRGISCAGERVANEANNAFQILMSAGNIATGTFRLYGVY